MKKLFTLSSPSLRLFIFAVCATLVVSCSDDPEPDVNDDEDSGLSCLPKAATKLDGKVFDYIYNGDNRLTQIELRDGSTILERYTVEYEGEVVKNVLFDDVVNQEPGQKYQIMYDGTGKPTEVLIFNSHTNTDVVPNKRIEFIHNDAGRIATKKYFTDGVWMYTVRYEYTSAGNVQKLFITTPSKAEYLASEFPSYDDKKRFYSASHELTLLEVYLFDYEPSVNNALKHVIYANVASTFTPAKELDYTLTYENNYVTSLKNGTNSASNTILFQSVSYQCE